MPGCTAPSGHQSLDEADLCPVHSCTCSWCKDLTSVLPEAVKTVQDWFAKHGGKA